MREFPVVLVGSEYWSGLVGWMRGRMLADGMISPEDLDRFVICDEPHEVVERVEAAAAAQGL